ncbi:MAG: hypothetical protein RIQ81_1043 [Pseudomonadota bacterium]|jgi:hypothetical protein
MVRILSSFAVTTLATIFLAPVMAFAGDVIMSPGETIVVGPSGESTSVQCRDSGNVTVLDQYCTCVDPGPRYMKRLNSVYVMSNGTVQEVYLGDFNTLESCEKSKATQDPCK